MEATSQPIPQKGFVNWKLRFGLGFLIVFVGLVVVRTFVARLYKVTSVSMEPTIHGDGEQVLVFFGEPESLERFDMVVVDRGDGGPPIVKRIGGLPGESVHLIDGDIFVGGIRVGKLGSVAPLVPLFDSSFMETDTHFDYRSQEDGEATADFPWQLTESDSGTQVSLTALDLQPGRESGMMRYRDELRDSYIDGEGETQNGLHRVNDAMVSFEFRALEVAPGARIRARLVEEGDTFDAILEINAEGTGYSLRIERNPGQVLSASPLDGHALPGLGEVQSSGWLRLSLSNIDNRLRASLVDVASAQELVSLQVDYDANRPYLGAGHSPGSVPIRSVASRVGLGGEAVNLELRNIVVKRDLFILPTGEFAVERPFVLGPGEYFLLGDNSAKSADSRLWGAIPARSIIGRPTRIVLPFARARPLD